LRHPASYRIWRTAILATTAIALVGFALFPLMPPRLLCDCPYGAGPVAAADGQPAFVDTLAAHGGLWSFDSGTMQAVSNQYAAMPSLHVAWALWCALALLPHLRRTWARVLALAYPLFTTFAVVVTGNHFWLDAVGGAVVLALGIGVASLWRRLNAGGGESAGTVAATSGPGPRSLPGVEPVAGAGAPHGTERRPHQEA
jgi:membrane-associated phospholipid phosphatase